MEYALEKPILEAVLASIPEAVIVVDPDTRIIRNCNAAAERIFGYERGQLVGTLGYTSAPGGGPTFRLTFPA